MLVFKDSYPTTVFLPPLVIASPASLPTIVLYGPVVIALPASYPIATL